MRISAFLRKIHENYARNDKLCQKIRYQALPFPSFLLSQPARTFELTQTKER